ncbi:MAG: acetyl-CoA carboxylase biotin carboxyl carrier protein [Nitrospinae bacterium]|nr:acetyl-CoA carboxylase biotin carboxyl carrier protein [Nitrospinota bacterium]
MDIKKLKKIISIFEDSKLSELELEDEELSVFMKKSEGGVVVHQQQPVQQIAPAAPVTSSLEDDHVKKHGKIDENIRVIESPMVGTFYRSPSPTTPSFVEVGDMVKKGQVLCIVEAMKLMNDIESPYDGKLVDVLVENGKPVEYGKPLFHILPSK